MSHELRVRPFNEGNRNHVGEASFSDTETSVSLSSFLSTGDGRPLTFEQLPFSNPLFILYTSGTSGPPKCIVHTAGVRN